MQFLTDFADQGVILPVALLTLLAFVALRWWRGARAWVGVLSVTLVLVFALKIAFHTCGGAPGSRPFNPSGHVASAAAVYGGLAAVVLSQYRTAALAPALLIACVIAFTRLALGVHTVADVATGGVIGLGAAAALRHFAGPIPAARCWQPALLALMVAVLLHGAHLDAEGAIRDIAARLRPAMACGHHLTQPATRAGQARWSADARYSIIQRTAGPREQSVR